MPSWQTEPVRAEKQTSIDVAKWGICYAALCWYGSNAEGHIQVRSEIVTAKS